jgi:hypothetical protein
LTSNLLQDGLLAHCFSFLDAKDLLIVELACSRFKRCIEEGKLWAAKCSDLFPELAHLLDDMDTTDLERQWPSYRDKRTRQLSAGCKRLFSSLAASSEPERYSLICDPVATSSVDHQEEGLSRTLSPEVRGRHNVFCYWSSSGSEDQNSDEFAAYRLCHPLCVVSSVQVRPFRAWFQGGSPIYAPKQVSVGLGGIHLPNFSSPAAQAYGMGKDPSGAIHANVKRFGVMARERRKGRDDKEPDSSKLKVRKSTIDWMTLTRRYPIQQEDRLQTVHLPPRTLAVGGWLQLNLHGRTQRQEADDRYYTCLGYVKAQGRPIYNFRLTNDEPNVVYAGYYYDINRVDVPYRLKLDFVDHLNHFGGLSHWSENQRCSESSRREARENGQPDPLDDFSGSEIGSDDMELNFDEFDDLDEIL